MTQKDLKGRLVARPIVLYILFHFAYYNTQVRLLKNLESIFPIHVFIYL